MERVLTMLRCAGGKAKPLKAPKKEKKDLDEDDLAFKAKQKAGMWRLHVLPSLEMWDSASTSAEKQ